MKWPVLGLTTALLLPPAAAQTLSTSARGGMPQAIERDNQVVLRHGWGISSIDFLFESGHVTGKLPFGRIDVQELDGQLKIDVQAPRKGSEDMAMLWRQALGMADYRMFVLHPFLSDTTHPDQLNFWIRGSLRINGVEVPGGLFLGQGHYLTVNNWWMGQPEGVMKPGSRREFRFADAQNHMYCVCQPSGGEANYTFVVESCLKPPDADDWCSGP